MAKIISYIIMSANILQHYIGKDLSCIGFFVCYKGSVIGYRMSDDYQSLIDALQDLSEEDKAELVRRVQELVGAASIEALTRFIGVQAQRSALLDMLRSAAAEFAKGG